MSLAGRSSAGPAAAFAAGLAAGAALRFGVVEADGMGARCLTVADLACAARAATVAAFTDLRLGLLALALSAAAFKTRHRTLAAGALAAGGAGLVLYNAVPAAGAVLLAALAVSGGSRR
jgi:hypothetical protein